MVNRVKEYFQNLIGSKSHDELLEHVAKQDTSEDYYTSFERQGRGHKGRTFKKEQQQLKSNPRGYVHRSKVIKERAFFIEVPEHRNIVAYFSVWGSAIRTRVPEALCVARPIFAVPNQEAKADGQLEELQPIIDWWEDHRMNEIWQKAVAKSYIHGTCTYYPLNLEDKPWYSGLPAFVVASDEARPSEWTLGHPVQWDVHPSNKELEPYSMTIKNAVFFDYSNSDDFDGVPYLIASWDSIIDLLFIQDAVNAFDQRMGNGFMVLVVPNRTPKAEMEKFEEKLKHLRTNRGVVVKGAVDEPVQIDWMGMGGAQIDFPGHLAKIEDQIAFDLGFPKRWLFGDSPGALESGGQDALHINIKLKTLFKPWTVWMKLILRYHGLIQNFSDVDIRPPYIIHISEQERVELDQKKADIIATKNWLTVDEQRELDGYEALTEEQKAELMPPEEGEEGSEKEEKPTPNDAKTTKTDAYEMMNGLFNNPEISINDLIAMTGVAKNTVSKIRSQAADAVRPQLKRDEFVMKMDAVALDDHMWRIHDVPLILPQEKQYGTRMCVRSKEEVARVFHDPKTPKEFRIGVNPTDDHASSVPLEVLKRNTIGVVNLNRLDDDGNIRGDITYDLDASKEILGENNWLQDYTTQGINPNTSVALYTRDRPENGKYIESNLDVRSFVFSQNKARNKKAGK